LENPEKLKEWGDFFYEIKMRQLFAYLTGRSATLIINPKTWVSILKLNK
jgi:hypothetical protein